LRLLVENLDAIATLCAGIFAMLWAWCRSDLANRELYALGRPERAIRPLLTLYGVLKLAAVSWPRQARQLIPPARCVQAVGASSKQACSPPQ
jgi:uncharacterized Zn finger protein